jgi:carbohydrate-selective porin OprB
VVRALAPVLVVTAASTVAADPEDKDRDNSWLAGEHATGDWGGVRDALGDRGISVDAIYAAELFSNLTGHRGTDALGHVDLALTLGALVSVQPVEDVVAKVAIYEGNPGVLRPHADLAGWR